ncbi:37S ribosomal protein S10 like [Verticillium longisporum]|nr:37S ribosomal protein S10 like [Verticillium longisporum]
MSHSNLLRSVTGLSSRSKVTRNTPHIRHLSVQTPRKTTPVVDQSFIFKKSQENFERITLRRLIQIRDGNPESVQLWLAFLQKHAYYGIGMKANVWEFSPMGLGKSMAEVADGVSQSIDSKWEHLAQHKTAGTMKKVEEILASRKFTTTRQD